MQFLRNVLQLLQNVRRRSATNRTELCWNFPKCDDFQVPVAEQELILAMGNVNRANEAANLMWLEETREMAIDALCRVASSIGDSCNHFLNGLGCIEQNLVPVLDKSTDGVVAVSHRHFTYHLFTNRAPQVYYVHSIFLSLFPLPCCLIRGAACHVLANFLYSWRSDSPIRSGAFLRRVYQLC